MVEYEHDKFKFTGLREDPLIYWEMTRRLWPTCVKFTPFYLSYIPLDIYFVSEDVFTIHSVSQPIKGAY